MNEADSKDELFTDALAMPHLNAPFRLLMALLALTQLASCANFLHGSGQSMQVSTWCKDRQIPAVCTAENSKGAWSFRTPGEIHIGKDFFHLQITCKSPFYNEVTVTVPSMLNLSTAGNVLLGGVVGTGLDVYTGSAFAYNRDVRISYPTCQ
jgi:hypothetical protein